MRKAVLLAVAAATVASSSACGPLGRKVFKEPVVNFQQLSINGLGLTGGSLDVILSVYNPNNYRLDATRLTYNLMIDSVRFGTGALDQMFTVQSGDSTIVRLPIAFTYAGIGEAGRQLINTGTVNYRVTGDVTVGTPLGNFTRPYDRTGRYSMLRGGR
jgi:LEA14-like dessication related protein